MGLRYAFDIYGAKKVSLGVFENNESAYYCYKAAGFKDVILDEIETLLQQTYVLDIINRWSAYEI